MTTALQATEAVYEKIRTGWGTTTAYTFDEEGYKPPAAAPWIRVVVRDRPSDPMTHGPVGGRHIQRNAAVMVQVFAPVASGAGGDGAKAALALAQTLAALFEGVDLATADGGALSFSAVDVRRLGVVEAKWRQVNLTAPFIYDATI